MKKLSLTLFLALICSLGFAQKQEIFKIDSLPKQGILLDKNWKWHAGDNPDWVKVDFDDSKWDTLNPTAPFAKLPQVTEAEIGWFRLNIAVDSSLINKPYIIDISPTGALEIYLNGKLIRKIGIVSKDSKIEEAVYADFNPLNIIFTQSGENIIAVRYSLTKSNLHFYFSQSPFSLLIRHLDGFGELIRKVTFENTYPMSVTAGIFIIMMFFHLFFYYFYPKQRSNLLFSIALLICLINSIAYALLGTVSLSVSLYYCLAAIDIIAAASFLLFLLNAVYEYLQQPRKLMFWGLVFIQIVYIICLFASNFELRNYNDVAYIFVMIITSSNYIFISFKSIKAGNPNAKFIFFGGVFFHVLFIAATSVTIYSIINQNYSLRTVYNNIWIIIFLSIPVSISLALARDFAQMSFSLQRNLDEVKQLSEEKQQILAAQNETLEKQVEARTAELKASQNQLIQSEKLASLGELTAGIAHEIQNPLNFVNNFSELSVDLVKDLKVELERPDKDETYVDELFDDLSQNQEKINHHGKRASSIVKGMLEHSRTSTGVKELTDINKLADEYLRLSYHGLRAKDKNFNSDFELISDPNLPKINIIPQDIGRVLLNIINNAFYAVNATKKSNPTVFISTQHTNNQIIISVKDNGNGIPKVNLEKIFQPFFTTKPTGQGTGLGLSLAYDIITKGHGGTIECESVEGEGTTFIVKLPV